MRVVPARTTGVAFAMKTKRLPAFAVSAWLFTTVSHAHDAVALVQRKKARAKNPNRLIRPIASLNEPGSHEDFVSLCVDSDGTPWVAYVQYDGIADTLRIAQLAADGLVDRGALSQPGNVYQPCLACAGDGAVWCVWSQMDEEQWKLYGRKVTGRPLILLRGCPQRQ